MLLFFFAAFGTVDHRQTGIVYEISGTVLNCFGSYLQDGDYLLSLCNYEFKFESEKSEENLHVEFLFDPCSYLTNTCCFLLRLWDIIIFYTIFMPQNSNKSVSCQDYGPLHSLK